MLCNQRAVERVCCAGRSGAECEDGGFALATAWRATCAGEETDGETAGAAGDGCGSRETLGGRGGAWVVQYAVPCERGIVRPDRVSPWWCGSLLEVVLRVAAGSRSCAG